jgi:MoaA/NifB/PqqE/SkfB family radical SAM enzyme
METIMRGTPVGNICAGIGVEKLSIEVTTLCNSSCLHCFVRTGISKNYSLSVELVRDIVREGHDAGYRHLHITGGEPLLWEGLFETINLGFDVGYETIFINTNGTLITQEVSERFAIYGHPFSISVSLDGFEALHDHIRGKGSHQKTIRGIETALRREIDVTVFTTVTKSLLPELPDFVDDLYRRFPNISYLILIQLLNPDDSLFVLSRELLSPAEFIRLVRMAALLFLGGFRIIVKKNPLANVVAGLLDMPWLPQVPPLYREGCIIVRANRDMGVVHSNRNSFGSYKPGMIREVLASPEYRRTVDPDPIMCPSCNHAILCKENGMIRPPQGYGDQSFDKPYCQKVLESVSSANRLV